VKIIQTFLKGTTIEFGEDSRGHQVYRVCSATGAMCRLTEAYHCALVYAQGYEEFYSITEPK
jgi:hypothetical protein